MDRASTVAIAGVSILFAGTAALFFLREPAAQAQARCIKSRLSPPDAYTDWATSGLYTAKLQISWTLPTEYGIEVSWRGILAVPSAKDSSNLVLLTFGETAPTVDGRGSENLVNQLTFRVKDNGQVDKIMRGPRINTKTGNTRIKEEFAKLIAAAKCVFKRMDAKRLQAGLRELSYENYSYD